MRGHTAIYYDTSIINSASAETHKNRKARKPNITATNTQPSSFYYFGFNHISYKFNISHQMHPLSIFIILCIASISIFILCCCSTRSANHEVKKAAILLL
jgi:hypothetical protein